jgi:serine protease Do
MNYMKKNVVLAFLILGIGALAGVGAYTLLRSDESTTISEKQKVQFASLPVYPEVQDGGLDFTVAAAKTVPAVVHIKVTVSAENSQTYSYDPFRDFFGNGFPFGQRGPSMGSGSGVIISADGYIVTNNHVIRNASKIEVILNDKRSFKGKVIGSDPNTDLALVKIDASNLPFVVYGNSDETKIGEWVLAVGNPFNLTSTVTAGIISAKGRNINIIGEDGNPTAFPIESFIQTDAAVNPGNSGGALVSTKGELIGINTAIASQTGSYAGYSFAVPVNLVKKVMDDLMEFGKVQRAFLGVQIQELNSEIAKEKGLSSTKGVLLSRVNDGGAAQSAGIEDGDVVVSVAGVNVNSTSELMEQVGRHRPGDKIDIKVLRNNKEKTFAVILRGEDNTTAYSKKEPVNVNSLLGAEFQELSASDKKSLKIENGIKVSSLKQGKLSSNGIRAGFIITKLNNKPINEVNEVDEIINSSESNMLMIEGVYPQNPYSKYIYSFNIK